MSNGSVLLLILLVQNINNRFDLRSLLLTVLQEATCVLGLLIKPSNFPVFLLNLLNYLGVFLVLFNGQRITLLKALHILGQASGSDFSVWSSNVGFA